MLCVMPACYLTSPPGCEQIVITVIIASDSSNICAYTKGKTEVMFKANWRI